MLTKNACYSLLVDLSHCRPFGIERRENWNLYFIKFYVPRTLSMSIDIPSYFFLLYLMLSFSHMYPNCVDVCLGHTAIETYCMLCMWCACVRVVGNNSSSCGNWNRIFKSIYLNHFAGNWVANHFCFGCNIVVCLNLHEPTDNNTAKVELQSNAN